MIAALVGAIGTFLRWYSWDAGIMSGGISGTQFGAGVITLIALVASGVLAYLGNPKNHLDKNSWLIVLGASGLASILCAIKLVSGSGNGFGGGSIGIGLILSTIGAVGTLVASYIFRNPNDDLKQSLSDMKKQVENKIDNDPNT